MNGRFAGAARTVGIHWPSSRRNAARAKAPPTTNRPSDTSATATTPCRKNTTITATTAAAASVRPIHRSTPRLAMNQYPPASTTAAPTSPTTVRVRPVKPSAAISTTIAATKAAHAPRASHRRLAAAECDVVPVVAVELLTTSSRSEIEREPWGTTETVCCASGFSTRVRTARVRRGYPTGFRHLRRRAPDRLGWR